MDYFLLAYIALRMKEMGFEDYTFELVRVKGVSEIDATNEYYYLTSKAVFASLIIRSDTNIFNEAADYSTFNFYGIQEFTGQILITQTEPIDLEFMRVIPRVPLDEDKQQFISNYLERG